MTRFEIGDNLAWVLIVLASIALAIVGYLR